MPDSGLSTRAVIVTPPPRSCPGPRAPSLPLRTTITRRLVPPRGSAQREHTDQCINARPRALLRQPSGAVIRPLRRDRLGGLLHELILLRSRATSIEDVELLVLRHEVAVLRSTDRNS